MPESLPYEIISEILSPLLKVPDDLFANNRPTSPFAQYAKPSTSAYLVVCKKWLLAATPLLYNVVVLRSQAQAEALAKVLGEHNGLGNHIRKLRVEGGYGDAMLTILASAPNITDLLLSMEIWGGNSTDGLCEGLPLVNPRRLIMHEGRLARTSKMVTNLVDELAKAIAGPWTKLTSFISPYARDSERGRQIFRALEKANRLSELVVLQEEALMWVYPIVKKCPLESVGYLERRWWWRERNAPPKDPALVRLIQNYEKLHPRLPLPRNADLVSPSEVPKAVWSTPMENAPAEIREDIWSRILRFALAMPERDWDASNTSRYVFRPESERLRRLGYLRVCKMFYRLGRPHYFEDITLGSDRESTAKLDELLSGSDMQPHIKTLYATNYRTRHFTWDLFEKLLDTTGSSLLECGVDVGTYIVPRSLFGVDKKPEPPAPPPIIDARVLFSKMPNLRRLRWDCKVEFRTPELDDEDGGELARLEALWIRGTSPTFLDALINARLPLLKTLYMTTNTVNYAPFLTVHGPVLTSLHISLSILDEMWALPPDRSSERLSSLCPNVVELVVTWPQQQRAAPPRNAFLSYEHRADIPALPRSRRRSSQAAASASVAAPDVPASASAFDSLKKLCLVVDWFPHERAKLEAWANYLLQFDTSEMPALEEVSLPVLSWPTTEREIGRSSFVKAAENLLEKGVCLAGMHGVRWKPRLRARA
uniref:F-box domain-containing protein n=1 Tax=Mycena chlorophos TaxID=658473 RepID=A0ABQ0L6X0_MYCCL|nr:predicted protein [Mycena chlorophos]